MTPELRIQIALGRSGHYFDIMRTTIFTFAALAAVQHFGPEGYSAPLVMLTVAATAYGILAGGVALDDLNALRNDMDGDLAESAYGKGLKTRNVPALKMISAVLLGLVGLALLLAILT